MHRDRFEPSSQPGHASSANPDEIEPRRPWIAVIGGTGHLISTAVRRDVDVVLLHDIGTSAVGEASHAALVMEVALDDREAVHRALAPLHEERPFASITSLTERGLVPAAAARERLGVAGNSLDTVRLLKDKVGMRAKLAESGLSPVRSTSPQNVEDLIAFCERVAGPVILKPSDGSGSR